MTHVLIRLDTPLHYDARPGPAGPTRLISAPVTDKATPGGPRSYFNAAGPYYLLVSCPKGMMPAILAASQGNPDYSQTYVRAQLGFMRPSEDASKPGEQGHQHRHIVIMDLVTTEEAQDLLRTLDHPLDVYSLAHILDNAPRSDKKGGARSELVGASLKYGEEMHRTTVRIPGPMMETLTAMPSAEGKFPKAVRDLGHFYTANPGVVDAWLAQHDGPED